MLRQIIHGSLALSCCVLVGCGDDGTDVNLGPDSAPLPAPCSQRWALEAGAGDISVDQGALVLSVPELDPSCAVDVRQRDPGCAAGAARVSQISVEGDFEASLQLEGLTGPNGTFVQLFVYATDDPARYVAAMLGTLANESDLGTPGGMHHCAHSSDGNTPGVSCEWYQNPPALPEVLRLGRQGENMYLLNGGTFTPSAAPFSAGEPLTIGIELAQSLAGDASGGSTARIGAFTFSGSGTVESDQFECEAL